MFRLYLPYDVQMYTRASASDYDDFQAKGWTTKELIPLMKKHETYQRASNNRDIHGFDGPIKVSFGNYTVCMSLTLVLLLANSKIVPCHARLFEGSRVSRNPCHRRPSGLDNWVSDLAIVRKLHVLMINIGTVPNTGSNGSIGNAITPFLVFTPLTSPLVTLAAAPTQPTPISTAPARISRTCTSSVTLRPTKL